MVAELVKEKDVIGIKNWKVDISKLSAIRGRESQAILYLSIPYIERYTEIELGEVYVKYEPGKITISGDLKKAEL